MTVMCLRRLQDAWGEDAVYCMVRDHGMMSTAPGARPSGHRERWLRENNPR